MMRAPDIKAIADAARQSPEVRAVAALMELLRQQPLAWDAILREMQTLGHDREDVWTALDVLTVAKRVKCSGQVPAKGSDTTATLTRTYEWVGGDDR